MLGGTMLTFGIKQTMIPPPPHPFVLKRKAINKSSYTIYLLHREKKD
jgi:hypothetical protein